MPLKVRPYLSTDFNAWLDLTAISSIELNEEFLIWNQRPNLPPESFSYLLTLDEELIASADLSWLDNKKGLQIRHWASRKEYSSHAFYSFMKEIIQLVKAPILIWVSSPDLVQYFTAQPKVKILDNRVIFFVEGTFLPSLEKNESFCDHIYGTCSKEIFSNLSSNLPVVKKEFLKPKFQTCIEFSLP